MNFAKLKNKVIKRLDDSDRGDRGWWVITRCHLTIGWIKGIAEYLYGAANEDDCVDMTQTVYNQLAQIAGIGLQSPGVQLRRHHLLNMEYPLSLIRRLTRNWNRIQITQLGKGVATSDDPSTTLEQILDKIVFAKSPWTPEGRIHEYVEFNIHLYKATKKVVGMCDQWIDRDEFDLFLSRIRKSSEIPDTITNIQCFRNLNSREKNELLREVKVRIPGNKSYQNWRDMGLHTFALFSLGSTFVRDGHRLIKIQQGTPLRVAREPERKKQLQVIDGDIPENPELEYPIIPNINIGTEAEAFVAKILRANGWRIVFYSRKRGYGFDLWAKKNNKIMVLEVKSSISNLGAITLTPNEYEAAQRYNDNYFLVLVENIQSDLPSVSMIQNPVDRLHINRVSLESYRIPANDWRMHATEIEV
jgi:hypothetical protein